MVNYETSQLKSFFFICLVQAFSTHQRLITIHSLFCITLQHLVLSSSACLGTDHKKHKIFCDSEFKNFWQRNLLTSLPNSFRLTRQVQFGNFAYLSTCLNVSGLKLYFTPRIDGFSALWVCGTTFPSFPYFPCTYGILPNYCLVSSPNKL